MPESGNRYLRILAYRGIPRPFERRLICRRAEDPDAITEISTDAPFRVLTHLYTSPTASP